MTSKKMSLDTVSVTQQACEARIERLFSFVKHVLTTRFDVIGERRSADGVCRKTTC